MNTTRVSMLGTRSLQELKVAFPYISKSEGAKLSPLFIGVYVVLFYVYSWFRLGYWPHLFAGYTLLAIVGATIHMMAYLEKGGWLTWGSKQTNVFWEDGVCLIPNALHFTVQAFGFACFWGIKPNQEDIRYEEQNVEVQFNQLLPITQHQVQMSHAASVVDRGFTAFFLWLLFGWKKGEKYLFMMRFGFRLMVVAYIWVTFVALYDHGRRRVEQGSAAVQASMREGVQALREALVVPSGQAAAKVEVLVNLNAHKLPIFPLAKHFELTSDETSQVYFTIPGDNRKYIKYDGAVPSGQHTIKVTERVCAVVPAGMKIKFDTRYAPSDAVNMKPFVRHAEKTFGFELGRRLDWILVQEVHTPWTRVREDWLSAETERHLLLMESLRKEDLPESSKQGGIVCF